MHSTLAKYAIPWLAAAGLALAADPVTVTLDAVKYGLQIEGPEGGSVCQFHGSDPVRGTVAAARSYGTLGGFPDDRGTTEFGRFCDTAFSTLGEGMGLSQVWSTPCGLQTPAGALGRTYVQGSWSKLDFSMYLPGLLPRERYPVKDDIALRGHTVPMLLAALTRARRENARILFWTDLHTDFPTWMWKDGLRKNPIPEEHWDAAALHIVYYVKYLTARHGVPVHTVSFQNEPDLPSRHQFTPEMLIRISAILRQKLDQAGLYGVRILPFTSMVLSRAHVPWMNRTLDTLERTQGLLAGPMADYQQHVDALGGHMSHGEPPIALTLPNIRFWRASGDFDNHWKGSDSVTFDMGPDDQVDEVIRTNTWLYGQNVSLAGIWQVALRMGHTVDDFVLPAEFRIERDFRRAAVAGASAVYPYLRPGMYRLEGSQGRGPREPYSVDGFGGSGQPEVIVISNSAQARTFRVRIKNAGFAAVEVHRATAAGKESLGRRPLRDGEVEIEAPADSVTSLVAVTPSSRQRVVMVVRDAGRLTSQETAVAKHLRASYDVQVVSQVPTAEEQTRLGGKRHPLDPMGAAAYLLSSSIDRRETAYAFRTAMAPVIAMGAGNRQALGIGPGGRVRGGEALSSRDPLDPPAALLEGGLPKACGDRAAWERGFGELDRILQWALQRKAS